MEKTPKELLRERLDRNYRDYLEKLQAKSVSELIALAPEITAAKQLHEGLADACMGGDVEFLLKLENPLEALAGSWEAELNGVHDEEMSLMLFSVREKGLLSDKDFLPGQAPEADTHQTPAKPKMDLIGHDGNIYAIMGRASGLLKDAGLKGQSDEMIQRVTSSGSYDEALHIISEYVETELSVIPQKQQSHNGHNESISRLTEKNIVIDPDMDFTGVEITAYVELWFDPKKEFGLVMDEESTCDLYAYYHPTQKEVRAEFCLTDANGNKQWTAATLLPDEKDLLIRMMEAACQKYDGKSLLEVWTETDSQRKSISTRKKEKDAHER